jgi:uncharacterized damage-inducible protein DinB
MRTIEEFLHYFRRQRSWTRSLVAAAPEAHFGWRPSVSAFSCGELVRHLIQSEGFWRRLILEALENRRYDPFGLAGTDRERMTAFRQPNLESSRTEKFGSTFAECLASWTHVQQRTEEELACISPQQLTLVEVEHPLLALRFPLWEALLTMVGHEVHHRGQLSAYLKALGAEQPAVLG